MSYDQISYAASIIRGGGLVAFPTETVYGLGANTLDPIAVAKIFALKERPNFDPLIVHIASPGQLEALTTQINEIVLTLVRNFWPGPLTMVLPKSDLVPDLVTSDLPTVGIRMPDHPLALELIKAAGCPIAAPSANKFGQLSPTTAAHVAKQLPGVDFILDGGPTTVGIESTIVSVENKRCTILRPGLITAEQIASVLPGIEISHAVKAEKLLSPGLLKSHYSPKKPLYILSENDTLLPDGSGIILHDKTHSEHNAKRAFYTSENSELTEVAANLFKAMHSMEDDPEIEQIYIEAVPATGLGIAIMDRMKKAAYQYSNPSN